MLKLRKTSHPYYCTEGNFFHSSDTNYEVHSEFDSWDAFIKEWGISGIDLDLDMNHVFRWDIERNSDDIYYIQLFFIMQRKGFNRSVFVNNIEETDMPKIEEWLRPHWEKIKELWIPFSKAKE